MIFLTFRCLIIFLACNYSYFQDRSLLRHCLGVVIILKNTFRLMMLFIKKYDKFSSRSIMRDTSLTNKTYPPI